MNIQTKQMNERNSGFDVLIFVALLLLELMLNIGCSKSQPDRNAHNRETANMDTQKRDTPNINISDIISWRQRFDDKNRLTELTDPAGRKTRFDYSEAVSGKTVVTKTNAEGEIVEFEYDDRGLITTMKDALGIVSYQYDALGRLIQIQRSGEPASRYRYDSEGRITSQSIGDFYTVNYTYDFMGRLSSLNTPVGIINYEYQLGQGLVIRELPNGVKTIWEFGVNGQLQTATHVDKQNFVIAEFRYQYRPDGLLDTIAEKNRSGEKVTSYKYDKVGRLIQVLDQSGNQYQYEYDQLGNRIRATSPGGTDQRCEYDWAGRLISLNGKECGYDAAGNLSTIHFGDSEMNYAYSQNQQLVSANDKVFYKYGGDGKLLERKVDQTKTKFISNSLSESWQPLVMESHASAKTMLIWEGNNPLIKISNGRAEYILYDHLGSARMIVDDRGGVRQQTDYSPFGEPNHDLVGNDLTIGFSGLFYDPLAKQYLTKARAYNPILGQFMQIEPEQRIPTGSQKNLSPYVYCGHDPVNFIDTDGAKPKFVWGPENSDWQYFRSTYLTKIWVYSPGLRQFVQMEPGQQLPPGSQKDLSPFFNSQGVDDYLSNVWNSTTYYERWSKYGFLAGEFDIWGQSNEYKNFQEIDEPFLGRTDENWRVLFSVQPVLSASVGTLVGMAYSNLKYASGLMEIAGLAISNIFDKSNAKVPIAPIFHSLNRNYEANFNGYKLGAWKALNDKTIWYWKWTGTYFDKDQKTGAQRMGNIYWDMIDNFIAKPVYGDEISPSNVGGVALSGAGAALDGLIGQIEGLTIDANNNLVLISKKGEQQNLSSIRLDDIVTVFRSVYINGEGPTVTIDPNPNDPEHSAMIIKHGKATENTYVGWVLYHADRLMKSYMLGVDNLTKKDVVSSVPGYQEVLKSIYFGDGISNTSNYTGRWERFWIVPAGVNQFCAQDNNLTLFEVPLKIKTQVMKWKGRELVDDLTGKSSLGARKFTEWFTKNYDGIAMEQRLMPPAGFGIKDSVQIFTELRQIAFITALAEKMRDQGVPIPFWMRDYEVKQVPLEKQTPALLISRTAGHVNAKIFGGVSLSANNKDVKQYKTIGEIKQLPEKERIRGEQTLKLANTLSKAVQEHATQTTPVQLTEFKVDNQSYQMLQLPGAETRALSPCRIDEMDLTVDIPGGRDIHLSRHFNSFFNPKDVWGQAWTMNLPRLEKIKVPDERTANQVSYHIAYELLTPLNSIYARFSKVEEVPVLKSRLQTPDKECEFFGIANSAPTYLNSKTLELIGKTGGSWHFTESGDLIAIEKGGFRIVYLRNESGNVKQIVGLMGRTRMASIDLEYDRLNRLISATGKNHLGEAQTVHYEYDTSGNLSVVTSAQEKLAYAYQNQWVSEANWQDSGGRQNPNRIIKQRFEYNASGQLIAKYDDGESSESYSLVSNQGSTTLEIKRSENELSVSSARYDAAFRPLEIHYTDGTQARWEYPASGGRSIEIVDSDGKKTHITESSDGTQRVIEGEHQPTYAEKYDPMGRLTQMYLGDQKLFHQQWSPSGTLDAIETENSVFRPQYDADGLTKSITISPPRSGNQLRRWESIHLDLAGRPVEMNDFSGLDITIQYDPQGAVSQFIQNRSSKNYGYEFSRDENGRIEKVKSSWGNDQFVYDVNGELSKMITNKAGFQDEAQATIEFQSGRVHKVVQFDGGQLEISYHNNGPSSSLLNQVICPNGLAFDYHYNSSGDLDKVNIGSERIVRLDYDDNRRIIGYSFCKN